MNYFLYFRRNEENINKFELSFLVWVFLLWNMYCRLVNFVGKYF